MLEALCFYFVVVVLAISNILNISLKLSGLGLGQIIVNIFALEKLASGIPSGIFAVETLPHRIFAVRQFRRIFFKTRYIFVDEVTLL